MIATLYAIAMFVLLVYGVNLLWLAATYARKEALLEGPVPTPTASAETDETWPIVTVQLPLYNEALVAERLIDTCAALDYPRQRLEIQVLDDSTDETTALVAARVAYWQKKGIDMLHIHRNNREGYKAGALQHGIRLARGSFFAIFDADFIPPSDFLRRMLPHFDDPIVGMVQARWAHLNADMSLLTRMQAFGLDAHFAIEQYVRNRAECFMNFNGTAGIWRETCIADAGGWEGDTLAEDLDLSYRAQLQGWKFRYVPEISVPSELPENMNALRTQQFRWTKGAAETAKKLLHTLWRSDQPPRVKWEGTLQLTAHLVFPFLLLAALLHAPLLYLENTGLGPGNLYFAVLGFGLIGFVGFFLAQLFAQRALYPNWPYRTLFFPTFMAGSIGLALNNTYALWQAFRGKRSAFVRTPKRLARPSETPTKASTKPSKYQDYRIPAIAWLEALLALYCVGGLGVIVYYQEWAALPFQLLFALGFGLVSGYSIYPRLSRA